ncbi:MAG: GntR family transcriptional regulator [Firmicutes bacterium]|nr:GntR family transcriptional regulator [Bacillota bacterium]
MIDYKTVSLANQVYERLENNILDGIYEAGEILSESKLSEELGVSRTPIREALARLQADRLIGDSPAGTVVLGITESDVRDMFVVKKNLEVIATSLTAKNISDEGLDKLRDVLEQQEFYAGKRNAEKVRDLDTEFHDIIYSECGSPVYQAILSPLHHKLAKYRKASLGDADRIHDVVEEHRRIYEALRQHNGMEVGNLMSIHIGHAFDNILKHSERK